jgi:hypothetical protein
MAVDIEFAVPVNAHMIARLGKEKAIEAAMTEHGVEAKRKIAQEYTLGGYLWIEFERVKAQGPKPAGPKPKPTNDK